MAPERRFSLDSAEKQSSRVAAGLLLLNGV